MKGKSEYLSESEGAHQRSQQVGGENQPPYTPFSFEKVTGVSKPRTSSFPPLVEQTPKKPTPTLKVPSPSEIPQLPESDFENWTDLLEWARSATEAEVCFLVDSQGFIFEHQGDYSYEKIEDIGSQLIILFGRVDDVAEAGKSQWLNIAYDSLFVTGIRLLTDGVEQLTAVFVTKKPIRSTNDLTQRIREGAFAL